MLKSLRLENFTLFPHADLEFGKHLNVIVGENGTGKSHLLKVAYSAIAVMAAPAKNGGAEVPSKARLERDLADKLQGVFRPDRLARLVTRKRPRGKCRLSFAFDDPALSLVFGFSRLARIDVRVDRLPAGKISEPPTFLPTRELLTIAPGFVALYENTQLQFEETWRDTCILLDAPLARGPRERQIRQLVAPLEEAMGGSVYTDRSGRFYLDLGSFGAMEMHLVAEGLRKLATIARLIASGSLLDKGYLFWDEPESNLNPRIIKTVARTILQLAKSGVQVFVATHSLFLMRELHLVQRREFVELDTRCFGLHLDGNGGAVTVSQGRTMDDVGDIASLNEELQQSERYIDSEMGVDSSSADAGEAD